MAKIYDSILDLIGHTPLVRFHALEKKTGAQAKIIGKLEFFNPGFSSKARIAKNMIEEAEKSGELQAGGTILEGTSGNTGIGLAMVAAAKPVSTLTCHGRRGLLELGPAASRPKHLSRGICQ